MKYQHFFWDFDGTLYDTYPLISQAVQNGLEALGLSLPLDRVYQAAKRSLDYAFETLAAPHGITNEQYLAAYRRHVQQLGLEGMRPYPGAAQMLKSVTAHGGRNYLYTHRGLGAVECLERDGLLPLFADAVTSADGFPWKPAPDALNHLKKKHGLEAGLCIMVGDRDIDLEAGKNASMAGALFDPENYYADYPAVYRFQTMEAMRRALTEEDP